ncbi:MAG TPA: PQQ-binding-like beta-propeller repeat protein [Thermoleophilaceae bacterium]|nr:PQQ-binding-like beta-propeller repeat protein [Thermoleophilaceae bacterium]
MRVVGIALVGAAVLATAAPSSAARTLDWTRFGVDPARSNHSRAATGIAVADLAHLERQDVPIPGVVDSSPVYLDDVRVAGRRRDVLFATTSYGRAVAVDAADGSLLWTYTPPGYDALVGTPQFTTSSPVVDRENGFLYSPSPDGQVRKLTLDGHEVESGGWPAAVTLDPTHEKLSSALNLAGRWVIATTAGYGGDVPPYVGHVALVDAESGAVRHVFNALCSTRRELIEPSTCDASDAGIWARAGAVVVPGTHELLVATGNAPFDGEAHWGDSVLKLSPNGERLRGNWTPKNHEAMERLDLDLGSTAPALLRSGRRWLALQGGKDGWLRLLDVADLNGEGRACECVGGHLQKLPERDNPSVMTTPAVWGHGGRSWAFVTKSESTTAYRLSEGEHPKLRVVWRKERGGTSPVVAGGLLYVYEHWAGRIAVYRPATGERLAALRAARGHWNSPIVAGGRVALGVGSANAQPATGVLSIYRRP